MVGVFESLGVDCSLALGVRRTFCGGRGVRQVSREGPAVFVGIGIGLAAHW